MSMAKPARRRIFIECTHTYFAGGSSGIRRVTRSLANAHRQASSEQVQVLPVIWAGRGFLRPRRILTEAPHPLLHLRARILALAARCLAWKPLYALWSALARCYRALCKRWRGDDHDAHYRLFGLLVWPAGLLFLAPVRLRRGDIVVLVDSTWDSPAMLQALFMARERRGIQVGAMLHDLFPLTIPQMCQADTVTAYLDWFQRVVSGVDFFITNSAATTRALESHLSEHPELGGQRLPAAHFRLGADLYHTPVVPAPGSNPLQALSGFVVLAVGTIEPRKNYAVILDALELLWKSHEVTLVIVGRPGWFNTEVMARIRQCHLGGAPLLHLDDADDATLAAAYQRADALVCASWAEGFGLPIVEGMRHGVPVLASDIDAFREVGGDACRYFAPQRPQQLAAQLESLIAQWLAGEPVRLEKCELAISWRESAVQFRDTVLRLAASDAAECNSASVSAAALSQE